ncbi:MAG: ATPase domain-containing protein [Candidatus Micrarchaeota archaeon]
MEKPTEEAKPSAKPSAKAEKKTKTMERVKTGINGLDELLMGGVPTRKHVALYGGPGTGKTSFGFEFIYQGAKMGENGVYISFEESPEDIVGNMKSTFPKMDDIDSLVKAGKMEVLKPAKLELEDLVELLKKKVKSNNVKRLVIDSATMIEMSFKSDLEYRRSLFDFLTFLRKLDLTSMMIVESPTSKKEQMRYGLEHFIMDGIINLYSVSMEEKSVRSLEVFKMRGTDHSRDLVPYKVTPTGMKIYVGEKVF